MNDQDLFAALQGFQQEFARTGDRSAAISNIRLLLEKAPKFGIAHRELGILLLETAKHQVSQIVEAEGHLRIAVESDTTDFRALDFLAVSIVHQGRRADAAEIYVKMSELDPSNLKCIERAAIAYADRHDWKKAISLLERVLELSPANPDASAMLNDVKRAARRESKNLFYRWPTSLKQLGETTEEAVRKHVLGDRVFPRFLSKNTTIVTIGSCFAENLARALRNQGFLAENITIGEAINSTFANRKLVEWLVDPSAEGEFTGARFDKTKVLNDIQHANAIIYTLGVAPNLFDPETGEIIIPKSAEVGIRELLSSSVYRHTSVQENVENVEAIFNHFLEINPSLRFVLSVSPVPLAATFGEDTSFEADCISKSTLRVVANEVISRQKNLVSYWPSFEVFRWLGAYMGPLYGTEDGSTSHVSEAMVGTMTQLFIEKHKVTSASEQQPH